MSNKFAVSRCCCGCPCKGNFLGPNRALMLRSFTTNGPYYNPIYPFDLSPSAIDKYNLNFANSYTSSYNFGLSKVFNNQQTTIILGRNTPLYFPSSSSYASRGFYLTTDDPSNVCMYRWSDGNSGYHYYDVDINISGTDYIDEYPPYGPSFPFDPASNVYALGGIKLEYTFLFAKNFTIYSFTADNMGNITGTTSVFSSVDKYMIGCLTVNTMLSLRGYYYVPSSTTSLNRWVNEGQFSNSCMLYTPKRIDRNCCDDYDMPELTKLEDQSRITGSVGGGVSAVFPDNTYMGIPYTSQPVVEMLCG